MIFHSDLSCNFYFLFFSEFQWVEANAEELPFEDESFDLYTIAFGIRNTTHIDKVSQLKN